MIDNAQQLVQLERGADRLCHLVQHIQLLNASQAFLEERRIVIGNRCLACYNGQQFQVGLIEGMFSLEALRRYRTDDSISSDHGHPKPRLGGLSVQGESMFRRKLLDASGEQDWLTGTYQVAHESLFEA